ncbi:PKD domain-containing protein [Halorubellus sp. PRR65]|uniref:PKD domain-containing protein n=1 Tax=Halorubellus sp. PRR65 TaxID=3098148 RepID=UPI002B2623F4|nr:PKD domain-containing protein [Halorubellus sp. PRR65]
MRGTTLRVDSRSQSEVIGFVLLFGVLITAAVGWQVGLVPQQNERVEFNHVQEVQSQMQELGATVGSMESGSGARQVAVSLGNRFPDRTLFVNPPPTGGRLATLGSDAEGFEATVANATALDEEENDYWTGANRSFGTAAFVYDPLLQAYDGGPDRIVYENSLVYSKYGNFWRQHAEQGIVNGRDISLVMVNGSYSKASSGEVAPTDVPLYPASASPTTVRVRNASGPIQIRVPTDLSQTTWRDRLASEYDKDDEDPDRYVRNVEVKDKSIGPEDWNLLVLTLEGNETYDLQLSKVRVGSPPEASEEPAYVTVVDGRTATVREGSDHRVTFQVRDRYDNPVSDATVNVSLVGPGELTADGSSKRSFTDLRTGPDGEVTVTYAVDDVTGDQPIEVRLNRSGDPAGSFDRNRSSNALVSFTVVDADSDDNSDSGIGEGTYTVSWPTPSEIAARSGKISLEDGNLTVDRSSVSVIQLNATTDGLSGALIEFSVSNQGVLAVKNATNRSNDAATAPVNLTVNQPGWAYVYATGGGTGDRIRIVVEQLNDDPEPAFSFDPSNPTTKDAVSFDASGSTDADGTIQSYQWDFGDASTETGETVSHSFDSAGTYTVTLTVTDDDGATNTTTRTVTVERPPGVGIHDDFEGGRSLDVNANWSRVNAPAGEVFVATGKSISNSPTRAVHIADVGTNGGIVSTSLDTSGKPSVNVTLAVKQGETGGDQPDSGEDLLVQYRANDGSWSTIQTVTATGSNEPYQQISATLTDANALHSNLAVRVVQADTNFDDSWFVDDICVSAGAYNCQPSANLSFSPPSPYAGTSVTFDAADSVDVDGAISSYEWAFGDGATATGESVTHTYGSSGTYQVTLTVTDDEGASATTTRTVTVQSTSGTLYYVGDGAALEGGDNSGSIDTDPRGGIEFNLSNGHAQSVTLLDVTINPLNDSIDGLSDKLGGTNGEPEVNEIVVLADTENGYVDYQLTDTEYQMVPADGLTVDLDNSASVNNGNPVMSSGSEARFYIYEFYDQSGPTNVNMTDERVEITISYQVQGGSTLTETFTMDLVAGPVAEAGPDVVVDEGSTGTLDASASSSPGGSITSYEWVITENPSGVPVSITDADTSTPTATFDATGVDVTGNKEVEVTLTTTNARGRASTDTVNVTVNDLDRSGLNYVTGSGSTNDEGLGSLDFTISNDDSSAVTVQNVTVSVSGGAAAELDERDLGTEPGTVEAYVESPSGDGWHEGTMSLGTTYQLDQFSQIDTGENARVTLAYFRKNNGDAVDVTGSTVTVTLGLSDGRTITVVIDDI